MLSELSYKIKEAFSFEGINKPIFVCSALVLVLGMFSFFSASMGFLNKVENEQFFTNFIQTQMIAYAIGIFAILTAYFLNVKIFARLSIYLYVFSIFLCMLIFIPGLELVHGGGSRWINLFGFSLQPADILKFSSIIIFSTYFSKYKKYLLTIKYGALYPILILIPIILVFFLQKDLGSLAIIFFIVGAMYILNKTKLSYLIIAILGGIIIIGVYSFMNSYVMDRIKGMQNESYQTKQSLIALGSGNILGRGYGQSVQKFSYLPEPAGDSIYAVVGEEFGFVGTVFVAVLFFVIILTSILIANKTSNTFNRNIIYGIALLFFAQFVMNTGSMTKIIPLSGDTLPFFSKGGTAIIMNMFELGVLLKLTRRDIIKEQ